ncbi:hypothetical protein ACFFX0_16225 [Citricoccus parietis]|uniref:Uncharacterized protein n=1 Tax=Citricoccus parietis TaxID=592307 RepID=A0ABV5G148_9MICC
MTRTARRRRRRREPCGPVTRGLLSPAGSALTRAPGARIRTHQAS